MTITYGSYYNAKKAFSSYATQGTIRIAANYDVIVDNDEVTIKLFGGNIQVGTKVIVDDGNGYSNMLAVSIHGNVDDHTKSTTLNSEISSSGKSGTKVYWNAGYTSGLLKFSQPLEVKALRRKTSRNAECIFDVWLQNRAELTSPDIQPEVRFNVAIPALPSYTVSYNSQGGSAVSAQTKWYNETLTLSTTRPTRLGYVFKGWATSSSGAVVYQPGNTYTANAALTLYAVWEPVYTVKYDLNGLAGATGKPENQTKSYNVDLTLSTVVPESNSVVYTFLGWGTHSGAIEPTYQPGDTYSLNENLTLYAVWRKNVDTAITLPKVNRVYPDASDAIDDTSEYVRVSAQVYVDSIWETETKVSITSERSDGETGPTAVTIYPSDTLSKAADVPALNNQIIWRSYLDDLKFSAEHQYTVKVAADTYRIMSGQTLSEIEVADSSAANRVSLGSPVIWTVPATLVPEGTHLESIPLDPPSDDWRDGCALRAEQTIEKLENGDYQVTMTCPEGTETPAYVWESGRVAIGYDISTDNNGMQYVTIPDFPETIPYSPDSEPLVMTVPFPDLPEGSHVSSVTLESRHGSAYFSSMPIIAVSSLEYDDTTITVTLSYPGADGIFANIDPQQKTVALVSEVPELVYTASATVLLTSAEFIMDFHKGGHGAAIGRHAPAEGLDIGWKTKFFDAVEMAKDLVVGAKATVAELLVNGPMKVTGESNTSTIKLTQGSYPKITRAGTSTSWLTGHKEGAVVQITSAPSDGSYSSMLSQATAGGNWSLGVLRNDLVLNYMTNGNLSSDNNNPYEARLAPHSGGASYLSGLRQAQIGNYWGMLSPYGLDSDWIRTTSAGLIPYDTSGSKSVLGTSGWHFKAVYANEYYNNFNVDINQDRVLWSGCYYMAAGQTATLNQSRSAQPNGVVLVFNQYNTSNQMLTNSLCCFVPKNVNGNVLVPCFSDGFGYIGCKIVGVWDTSITGLDASKKHGTQNGVTYDNRRWVMSKVLGV